MLRNRHKIIVVGAESFVIHEECFLSQLTLGAIPELARYIDHTLLLPNADQNEYEKLCAEAIEHAFFAVCVPPYFVPLAAKLLKKSQVKVCSVIGFPNGYHQVSTKTLEAKTAIDQGAHELDMVINIAALKSGDRSTVSDDIRSVVRAASGRTVKVILETCYLTKEEKETACDLAMKAGAHFVKTSTGFGPHGATEQDVALLTQLVGGRLGVKASGGIHDAATASRMISLGATRLGTSHGVTIVTGRHASPSVASY
jgi:deoxyribose-phosphate aldolase